MAIWKVLSNYFLFDPNDRNYVGDRVKEGTGVATVTKFFNIEAVARNCYDKCVQPNTNAPFTLTPIYVKKIDYKSLIPPKELKVVPHNYPPPPRPCIASQLPVKVSSDIELPNKLPTPPKKLKRIKPPKPVEIVSERSSNTPSLSSLVMVDRIHVNLVPIEKPKAPSLTYFVPVDPNRYEILHASYHQNDPELSIFRGKQELANAVAAIATLRKHKSRLWFKKILDEVLMTGERIYMDSLKNMVGDQPLGIHQLTDKIKISTQFYTPVIEETTVIGRLNSFKFSVLDLLPALEEFFSNNDQGIIRGPLQIAVWSEDGKYYMFDPNERDEFGRAIPKTIRQEPFNDDMSDQEVHGFACLTWFVSLEDLANIYIRNVEKAYRRELFTISKTVINDYVELPTEWNNFVSLREGKWILRGTINQNNSKFTGDTRNTQCTAMASMAIIYLKMYNIALWDRNLIDEILDEGDIFYMACIQQLKTTGKFKDKMLMMAEIMRRYVFNDREFLLEIEDCLINGLIHEPDESDVLNLSRGIEEFFEDNNTGVITARGVSIAFWRDAEAIYYFDSHSRDSQGYACVGGLSCVLRFSCIKDMVKLIVGNLDSGFEEVFNITRIDIKQLERTPEGLLRPEFGSFTELNVQKGILRASTHQGNTDIYDTNADKQTIGNIIAAFGMANLRPSGIWKKETLDEILTIGDKLYDDSRKELVKKDMESQATWNTDLPLDTDEITTDNVLKEFWIGVNKVVLNWNKGTKGIFVEDDPQWHPKDEELIKAELLSQLLEDALITKASKDPDVKNEVILESQWMTVGIWTDFGVFYLFDPKGKDIEGNTYGREFWSAKLLFPEEEGEAEIIEEGETEEEMIQKIMSEQLSLDEPRALLGAGEDPKKSPKDEDIANRMAKAGPPEPEPVKYYTSEIDYTDAKAYVLMFTDLNQLISHIVENVPPNKQQEEFKLHKLSISARPELKIITNPQDRTEGNWYEFKEIDRDRWILRGTLNLHNRYYPPVNRGKQAGSMGIAGCVFGRLYALPKFKPITVDNILKYGDRLHTVVLQQKEKELLHSSLGMTADDIKMVLGDIKIRPAQANKQFYLGNYLVEIEVVEGYIQGDLMAADLIMPDIILEEEIAPVTPVPAAQKAKPGKKSAIKEPEPEPEPEPVIPMEDKPPVIYSLKSGIEKFFEENSYGIFQCKTTTVAIWKIFDFYYMFDPEARGPLGVYQVNGTACITRYANLIQMVKVIEQNLAKDGSNVFTIDNILIRSKVAKRPQVEVKQIIPADPKYTAFQEICPGKMILRGSFHQDNPKFKLSPNAACCTNALVALAMSQIHKTETWTKPIIDEILANGLNLYRATVLKLGYAFNTWNDKVILDMVNREFSVGVMRVNVSYVIEDIKRGILKIKDPDILNLRQACEEFFEEHRLGVIESDCLTTAVWYENKLLYMFDPNSRGTSGHYTSGGTACLVVFKNIKFLIDHFISNIPTELQHRQFTITPVEVSIAELKESKPPPIKIEDILKVKEIDSLAEAVPPKPPVKKKKKTCKNKKPKKLPCCCPGKEKVRPNAPLKLDKIMSPDQKKLIAREMGEARKEKETQAVMEKMRKQFYTYDNGDAILRAHFSQNSTRYGTFSRNKQSIPNALVSIVMAKLHEPKTWTWRNIEIVLDSADVLYKDSFIRYRPLNPQLGLRNVLRTFYILHLQISTIIYHPCLGGHLKFEELYYALLNFFMHETAGIIRCDCLSVAVFTKKGDLYMFDPHDCDVTGARTTALHTAAACLMRFGTLESLIERYLTNTGIDRDSEEDTKAKFSITAVTIESVQRTDK